MSLRTLIFRGRRSEPPPPGAAGPTRASIRLLWQADPVLVLVTQLRTTSMVADIARLREKIAGILLEFHMGARAAGIDATRVAQATAVLAALIDHVVTSMPWGADAGWRSLGKATATSGSLRPAQRLLEVANAPSLGPGMNELIGVAIALGFDKRTRGADGPQIEKLLARLAPSDPGKPVGAGAALSPDLPQSVQRGQALTSWLPLWVSSLVVAALLAGLFFGLELSLGASSDRLYARLAALNGPAATTSRPRPATEPRLAGVLSAPAAARSLFVRDEIDRSVIVVPQTQLFEAGDPTLKPAGSDVLRPIVAALQASPGRIQIIGHTDGTLARSARYPSDWELSVDRARAVRDALRNLGIDASRLGYDGRGSIEPLTDDGARAVSGAGRIEIILLAGR